MTHFIREQHLHIDLKGTESEGFAMQKHLPEMYYARLLPALEKAFDKCSVPGKLLIIDKLVVNAGTIELERFDQDLADKIIEALIPQIMGITSVISTEVNETFNKIFYREETENALHAFNYFLKSGFLPWSFKLPADKTLEQVLAEIFIEKSSTDINPGIMAHIADTLNTALFAERLVMQFSEAFIMLLLEKINSGTSPLIESLVEEVTSISLPLNDFVEVKSIIFEKAVMQAVSGKSPSKVEISKQVLEQLRVKPGLFLEVSKAFEHTWLELKPLEGKPVTSPTGFTEEINRIETNEGIYIENAGLILLHPFLSVFFDRLGIKKDSEIVHPDKAMALLHYLATGIDKAPEYELVLPKILCNIPLPMPVSSDIEITGNETEEASALLDSVIKHWEALRNISRDGLRGSFLLRPGKLSCKNDGDWLLQVEPRTFDILLDQLPWGISMVKLPWMEKMIWVEWRT